MLVGRTPEFEIFGEDQPVPYTILGQISLMVGDIPIVLETIKVPAYPLPASYVIHEKMGVEDYILASDWQFDPTGENISRLFRSIAFLNFAESTLELDQLELDVFSSKAIVVAECLDRENAHLIQVIAGLGKDPWIMVTINNREDAYWTQDEWLAESDPNFEAIGAIFGVISEVRECRYTPSRFEEERPEI